MKYAEFLASKASKLAAVGIAEPGELNPMLFDFQRDVTAWALRRGRAAIFADCGLGKTPMQLEWARKIVEHSAGNVLILAPLAVSHQTVREGEKFGVAVNYAKAQSEVAPGITITNYERMERFDSGAFAGVVLDESSILKSFTGKIRTLIIEAFAETPYRLACTATPAPNDFMELGNHSEFFGVMTRAEMLSMYFVHDGGETQKWRLKGHAEDAFWKWLCSWAVMLRKPSDLGYDDGKFTLPPLNIHNIRIPVDDCDTEPGMLFRLPAKTLSERQTERRITIDSRAIKCAELCNATADPCVVWCNLNAESSAIKSRLNSDGVEVRGSDAQDHKESAMLGFSDGNHRVMVTKPRIAGFGMNWQHCSNVMFLGLSDSYEQYYQAVRRCWRFGQTQPVDCYIVTAATEGAVVANIQRKEKDAQRMAANMVKHMAVHNVEALRGRAEVTQKHQTDIARGKQWECRLGDSVEELATMDSAAIGLSVYSPPFSSLYTYSDSPRDLGNCRSDDEFFSHYQRIIDELYRVTIPGRCSAVHCMNLPTSKTKHGIIGVRDFRGDIIRAHQESGWIYHSEVCIWKDPVTAMQRTKALGLLHKQLVKDSCMSRQGIPDYLVTFRKPGENPQRVAGELDTWIGEGDAFQNTGRMSIDIWQRYASPIWADIRQSRTLQKSSAREHKDERHICPLQLDVIDRALQLWSNPRDIILDPFAGIGSTGHCALGMGRKFIGVELKRSYWTQAVGNLERAERAATEEMLPLWEES